MRTATLPQARCCAKWSEERACFDALAPESDECIGADQIKALLTAIHPSKDGVSEEDLDAAEVRPHRTTRRRRHPPGHHHLYLCRPGPAHRAIASQRPSPRKAAFERAPHACTRLIVHHPPPARLHGARGARTSPTTKAAERAAFKFTFPWGQGREESGKEKRQPLTAVCDGCEGAPRL